MRGAEPGERGGEALRAAGALLGVGLGREALNGHELAGVVTPPSNEPSSISAHCATCFLSFPCWVTATFSLVLPNGLDRSDGASTASVGLGARAKWARMFWGAWARAPGSPAANWAAISGGAPATES